MVASKMLSASLEDYLEAIFHIVKDKKAVRAKDISKRLKVTASSVTGALRSLSERDLVNYAPYDVITLTQRGEKIAKDVVRRHEALRDFFVKVLMVEEQEADQAACRMEHAVPKTILERFIQFAEFVEVCPRGGAKWIAGFGYNCDHKGTQENCESCISHTLEEIKKKRLKRGSKAMATLMLKELQPGAKAKVTKIKIQGETNKRIVEMGVTRGALIEIERVAPMGDPIDVKVRGYHLSLRKAEADNIEVQML